MRDILEYLEIILYAIENSFNRAYSFTLNRFSITKFFYEKKFYMHLYKNKSIFPLETNENPGNPLEMSENRKIHYDITQEQLDRFL